eukprot:5568850-Lingulodinium_polyedra.AAC.1
MAKGRPAFDGAVREGDVVGAQAAFDAMANEWLARRKHVPVPEDAPPAVLKKPIPRQTGPNGEATNKRTDEALLKVRRLRSLRVILEWLPAGAGQRPVQAQRVVDALVGAAEPASRGHLAGLRWEDPAVLGGLLRAAEADLSEATAEAKRERGRR